jgi:hypothetical protein
MQKDFAYLFIAKENLEYKYNIHWGGQSLVMKKRSMNIPGH